MKTHPCASNLRLLAITAGLTLMAWPSAAKDIVAFADQVATQANPGHVLILHNKETWSANIVDTLVARFQAKSFKYDLTGYNQGDRPRDIARPYDWPGFGAVFCFGQYADCDQIKAQAVSKGFEGDFYGPLLEKR